MKKVLLFVSFVLLLSIPLVIAETGYITHGLILEGHAGEVYHVSTDETTFHSNDAILITPTDLKLLANVEGDVILFGDADVDDAVDGKELRIWRKAVEGDNYLRAYVTSTQNALIHSNTNILFQNSSGKNIQINSGQHIYLNLGDTSGNDEVRIRDNSGNEVVTINSNGKVTVGASLIVSSAESSTGPNARIEIENTAAGGGRWFLRAGATGTPTPAGGFSIADTSAYRWTMDGSGNVVIGGNYDIGGNITVGGTVDGRDIATDGTKLDGIVTGAEVATKEFFISAGAAILSSNASYDTPNNTYQVSLADAVTFARVFFTFHLPSDFSSMASGYPKVVFKQGTGGTGNYRIAFNGRAGGVGEQMGSVLDNIAEYTMAAPGAITIWEEDISANFDGLGLAAGDSVGLQIQRDSDDANDTFAGDLDVVGLIVKY